MGLSQTRFNRDPSAVARFNRDTLTDQDLQLISFLMQQDLSAELRSQRKLPLQTKRIVQFPIHLKNQTLQLLAIPKSDTFKSVPGITNFLSTGSMQRNVYKIQFQFDCTQKCSIRVYYSATETPNGNHPPTLTPSTRQPLDLVKQQTILFPVGFKHSYEQPDSDYFDPALFYEDELVYDAEKTVFPLVIVLETEDRECSEITYAALIKCNDESYVVKPIKQKLRISDSVYALHDMFGLQEQPQSNPSSQSENNKEETSMSSLKSSDESKSSKSNQTQETSKLEKRGGGKEEEEDDESQHSSVCVVCLTDPRSVIVLPCRHLCLCRPCSDTLRAQSSRCPICRSVLRGMVEIDPTPLQKEKLKQSTESEKEKEKEKENDENSSMEPSENKHATTTKKTKRGSQTESVDSNEKPKKEKKKKRSSSSQQSSSHSSFDHNSEQFSTTITQKERETEKEVEEEIETNPKNQNSNPFLADDFSNAQQAEIERESIEQKEHSGFENDSNQDSTETTETNAVDGNGTPKRKRNNNKAKKERKSGTLRKNRKEQETENEEEE